MLIDRTKIIEAVRLGMGSPAASPFAPSSPDFNSMIQPLPYDPKRAAQLLDEAGWLDHNGNGVRDKGGVEFKFEVVASSSNAAAGPLLGILQDELGKAGITVTGRRLDPAVLQSTLRDHQADAGIGTWISARQFDPYQLFHSDSAKNRGSNYYNFRNSEADAIMKQARVEFDAGKLYYPKDAAAYQVRFHNVQFLAERPGYEITQWSVSPGAQRLAAAN